MSEEKKEELKRQKDIGQFFTPQVVVEFIYDILKVHLDKEEKWKTCTGNKRKRFKKPSIIDPSCGEGIFLKIALEKKITHPLYVFGIDIDDKMKEEWKRINLLSKFGSEAKLESRFFHQNSLLPIKHDPKYRYRGIKKNALKEFDLVVGNPPYGGVGLKEISKELSETLVKYEIWKKAIGQETQGLLFLDRKHQDRLKTFPIEILFVERFIQLAKPGGHIAIIIPDGILSNSNLNYVREFIDGKVKVEAIVSLPRETFKDAGTSAKTSILFMTKPVDGKIETLDYPVFLASVEKLEGLNKVYEFYCRYQKEGNLMNPVPRKIVVVKDSMGNDAVYVRVDITKRQMNEQKPAGRWGGEYWDPKFTIAEDTFALIKHPVKTIDDFEEFITYGPIVVGKKFKNEKEGVILINQTEIEFTGLDFSSASKAQKDSLWVIERAKPENNDLLLARSGMGGVGKNKITIFNKNIETCVGCFVDILRLKDINPYYVLVFWKGIYGWSQINRIISGVGTVNINFDQIRSIKIPVLSENIQSHIESEYKKMSVYHDKAMEANAKGNEADYKKNIQTAEKMLKDLITRTEAVIRGEREDVI